MTLDWAMRWGLLIGLPATVGLFLLAPPMIVTLFQYGEFNVHAVSMTSLSLMAYSIGLIGFIMVKVLVPGFFARQDARTPVRIGIVAMVANMLLNIAIVVPMAMSGATAPHAGLALATSCSSIINASLLFHTLRKNGIFTARPGWPILLLQIILACMIMGVYLAWAKGDTGEWLRWDAMQRIWNLTIIIAGAALVYITSLLVLGARPWRWRVAISESV